jgi:hypothetical protein
MTGLSERLRPLLLRLRRPPAPALIGHSHSQAIFDAAARDGVRLRGFNFWTAPQPALDPTRTAFHPEIEQVLSQGVVFSAVGGAVHNILSLVAHPRPFDFVLPERPDLPIGEGAEVLPFAAVRDAIAAPLQEYLDIIALVRRTATGRVFHIDAPPPLEDGDRVLQDVPWMFFQNLTREVAPATVRWKCWRVHSALVAAFCAAHGVEVLAAPAASMDGSGYLRPEFYKDAMHVQETYGALVLRQMKEVL